MDGESGWTWGLALESEPLNDSTHSARESEWVKGRLVFLQQVGVQRKQI